MKCSPFSRFLQTSMRWADNSLVPAWSAHGDLIPQRQNPSADIAYVWPWHKQTFCSEVLHRSPCIIILSKPLDKMYKIKQIISFALHWTTPYQYDEEVSWKSRKVMYCVLGFSCACLERARQQSNDWQCIGRTQCKWRRTRQSTSPQPALQPVNEVLNRTRSQSSLVECP